MYVYKNRINNQGFQKASEGIYDVTDPADGRVNKRERNYLEQNTEKYNGRPKSRGAYFLSRVVPASEFSWGEHPHLHLHHFHPQTPRNHVRVSDRFLE